MKNQRIKQITNHLKSSKKRIIGRSLLTLLVGATLYGFYTASKTLVLSLQAVESITVQPSALYSNELVTQLSEMVKQAEHDIKNRSINIKAFCSTLKNTSPLVQSVEWKHNGQGVATITITGDAPLCLVNGSSIITQSALLSDAKNFETFPLETLAHIETTQTVTVQDSIAELKTIAQSMPGELLENYALYYKGSNEIYLQEKNSLSSFVAITTSNQLKNMELIRQAKQLSLRDEYLQKSSKKRARHYAFDIRFNNRIIAKPFPTNLKEL